LNQPDPAPLPGVTADPVFSEPWQASAFALTVALHQQGLFSWTEWADTLAQTIREDAGNNTEYYQHWLTALERIVAQKGVSGPIEIETLSQAWSRAAEATPHGTPIILENDPLWPVYGTGVQS
jgi:nitrile hydratase accessory protein